MPHIYENIMFSQYGVMKDLNLIHVEPIFFPTNILKDSGAK